MVSLVTTIEWKQMDRRTDAIALLPMLMRSIKMKKCETPALSGLAAEMIQATGDIGTQWILHYVKVL